MKPLKTASYPCTHLHPPFCAIFFPVPEEIFFKRPPSKKKQDPGLKLQFPQHMTRLATFGGPNLNGSIIKLFVYSNVAFLGQEI